MPIVLLLMLSQCWAGDVLVEDILVVEKTDLDLETNINLKTPVLDLKPRLSGMNDSTNKVVMVPPGTQRVLIQQSNYEFKEEAKSFRRFRWHYMAYFSLWFTMMVTNVSWEE